MDTIANMLTIIRNGCMAKKSEVIVQYSKINEKIIDIFKKEGFILGYEKEMKDNHPVIKVKLGYDDKKRPIINSLIRVSKPGRRVYVKHAAIQPVKRGLGVAILSTSKGVMTDKEAIKNNIGGELLCKIW